jgi:hypothetical protein
MLNAQGPMLKAHCTTVHGFGPFAIEHSAFGIEH